MLEIRCRALGVSIALFLGMLLLSSCLVPVAYRETEYVEVVEEPSPWDLQDSYEGDDDYYGYYDYSEYPDYYYPEDDYYYYHHGSFWGGWGCCLGRFYPRRGLYWIYY